MKRKGEEEGEVHQSYSDSKMEYCEVRRMSKVETGTEVHVTSFYLHANQGAKFFIKPNAGIKRLIYRLSFHNAESTKVAIFQGQCLREMRFIYHPVQTIEFEPSLKATSGKPVKIEFEELGGMERTVEVVYIFTDFGFDRLNEGVSELSQRIMILEGRLKRLEGIIEQLVNFKPPCGDKCICKYLWDEGLKFEFIQLCLHCPRRKLHL